MIRSRAVDEVWRAAALHPDLHDAFVLPRRRQHCLAFADVDADRLLDVDIGAGLDCLDHRQRMPVVGRRDEDDVEVLLREHLAVVAVGARGLFRRLARGDLGGGIGEHAGIDVTERDHLDGRDLQQPEQVAFAVPPRADQSDPLPRRGLREAVTRKGRQRQGGAGVFQKGAAIHEDQACITARPRWQSACTRELACDSDDAIGAHCHALRNRGNATGAHCDARRHPDNATGAHCHARRHSDNATGAHCHAPLRERWRDVHAAVWIGAAIDQVGAFCVPARHLLHHDRHTSAPTSLWSCCGRQPSSHGADPIR